MTKLNDPITVSREIGGRTLTLETGRMAKQAGGAISVRGQPQARAQLFRVREVGIEALCQGIFLQQDDALVAIALVRINGNGQLPSSK